MYALLLLWDLKGKPTHVFQTLRDYIANESWERYRTKEGLCQKTWFSDESRGEFGAFYLWETEEAMDLEITSMYRVEAMTGVAPSIHRLNVEAIAEGNHHVDDLLARGLAWQK